MEHVSVVYYASFNLKPASPLRGTIMPAFPFELGTSHQDDDKTRQDNINLWPQRISGVVISL
jgi:hypothetical protein